MDLVFCPDLAILREFSSDSPPPPSHNKGNLLLTGFTIFGLIVSFSLSNMTHLKEGSQEIQDTVYQDYLALVNR